MKRGQREAAPDKPEKPVKPPVRNWRGNIFADVVVTVCLLMGGFITVSTVWEYHRLDVPMPADVILALMGLWGGELLILAGRQILGSDALPWSKKTAYNEADEDDVLGV